MIDFILLYKLVRPQGELVAVPYTNGKDLYVEAQVDPGYLE